jgi:hypothetical protein
MYTSILNRFVMPICFVILGFTAAQAQTDSTAAKDSTTNGKLTISGYVDVYYTYNFNKPAYAANNPFTAQPLGFGYQNAGRIFDIKHNSFSVGLVQTKFTYTKNRSELVMDLVAGPNAELGNFGNVFGSMIAIKQAYIAYDVTDKLTVTAGQFGTHVGYELIDAPLNTNYSLSYLFGNGPFYHTGLKAAYAISDKFGIMGGIVNGWDGLFAFNNKKSFIGQVYLAPVEGLNIYVNYVGGDNKNGYSFPTIGSPGATIPDSIKTPSHLFDLTSTFQVSDKFKLGLNAAYGFGHLKIDPTSADGYADASWYGAALYMNYGFSDHFLLSLRSETFSDQDGVRYIGYALGKGIYNEFTLTGDITLENGNLHIKPEFRIDIANKDIFVLDPTSSNPKAVNTQPTLGMAAIYSF